MRCLVEFNGNAAPCVPLPGCIECLHFLDFVFPVLDEDDVDDRRESALLDTLVANGPSPPEVLDLLVGCIVNGYSETKFSSESNVLAFHGTALVSLVQMSTTHVHHLRLLLMAYEYPGKR